MYLRVKLRERCAHTSFGLRRYLLFTISVVCASMHSISSIWFYISHNNHYCTLFRSISFRSLYLWSSTESIDSSGRRIFLPNYTLSVQVWSRTALSHSTWSSYFPTDYLWMVRRFVRMMCINAEATAWGWIRSSCDCLHWRGRWWWLALKRDVENRQFTFRHFSSGYTTHSQHTHMALAIVTMSNET